MQRDLNEQASVYQEQKEKVRIVSLLYCFTNSWRMFPLVCTTIIHEAQDFIHNYCSIIFMLIVQKEIEERDERIKQWEEFKVVSTKKSKPKVGLCGLLRLLTHCLCTL